MANQDPQPEIYSTTHTFTGATAAGTVNTQTIFTNQANNEEVRLYALAVNILDAAGTVATTQTNFQVSIQCGPNNVPSNAFDISWVFSNINAGGPVLAFSTPILILFQQPLAVTVSVTTATTATRTVNVSLIGELAIQKEYYNERFSNGSPM